MTQQLSPAAQAVAKAALYVSSCDPEDYPNQAQEIAAAALRAAADLTAPDDYKCFTGNLEWDAGMEARTDAIREKLLAIAAELEAQ